MPKLANYKSNLKSLSNYNNVENFSKRQFGYLGEPLIVSDTILDAIIVHHMNTNNVNYVRSAPQIPKGAPMADFIYEDIMLRSEEIIQRYLCGEDEILATRSQMSRMILKHLKKYHSLLKSTAKEAKLALNKDRKRRLLMTNASSNLQLANVSNMVSLQKEIEKKQRDLLRVKSQTNTATKNNKVRQLNVILEQLKRRKKEVNKQLKSVPPEKKTRAQKEITQMKNDTGELNYSKILYKTYSKLSLSTQVLVSPTYVMKGGATSTAGYNPQQGAAPQTVFNYDEAGDFSCASYPKITDRNTAHLVFSSHPIAATLATAPKVANPVTNRFAPTAPAGANPTEYFLLQCEDTRINSTSASDFDDWRSDPRASQIVPFKGVMESMNRKQIPFRTVFGDRLVKRRLVLHSFVERLNAALYLNYTRNNTRSELHPLYNRYSGLFLENMNTNLNVNKNTSLGVSNETSMTTDKTILKKYGFVDDNGAPKNGINLISRTGEIVTIKEAAIFNEAQARLIINDLMVPRVKLTGTGNEVKIATSRLVFAVPGSALYNAQDSKEQRSSSRLFSMLRRNANKIGNVNTTTDDLLWNQKLRSFGASGPQDYWIQLLREMYDARRTENVRSKLRIMNSKEKKNAQLKPQEVMDKFKSLNLGDDLGVTCYGYACNPRDPSAPWGMSYHRFGRAWFCADVNKDPFQLPFGCYSDRCAPPLLPLSHPNYHSSNSGTESSRIKGDLELVAVNNICTTVLQHDSKYGTQGRFGHIKTAYKGQRIGKMSPEEAFDMFATVRQAKTLNSDSTTIPYEITMGLTNTFATMTTNSKPHNAGGTGYKMTIKNGPELKTSILRARKTIKINNSAPLVAHNGTTISPELLAETSPYTNYNNFENMTNNISTRKNSEVKYNINKLKNSENRHQELRKYLELLRKELVCEVDCGVHDTCK